MGIFSSKAAMPFGGDSGSEIDQEILADKVRLLYEQLLPGLIATVVNAVLSAIALRDQVAPQWLGAWLAAVGIVTVGRSVLLRRYLRRKPVIEDARLWARRFVVGAFFGGSVWGALGSLLFPSNSHLHQAFVAFVIAGMMGGALSSLSYYRPAYRAYLVPTIIPYAIRLIANGDLVSYLMTTMLIVYFIYMLHMSSRHYRMVTASLHLRYDVRSLRNDLQVTKKKEAILNEELEEEISERKRTEAALQSSAEICRLLVETAGMGYHVLDDRGHVLDANATYVDLTGHRLLREIQGRHVAEWTARHDQERSTLEVEKCLALGAVRNLEIDYALANGRHVPIEINATVLRDTSGTRIIGLCRDITERKAAETALWKAHGLLEQKVQERTSALAQEKERFRVTLASIADAVITTNAAAQITYLNPVAEHLTGWESEKARGLSLSTVFGLTDDTDSKEAIDVITRCIAQGLTIGPGHHWHLYRKDGGVVSIDMAVAPIFENADKIVGAVLTFRDVTEQRAITKQLTHQATHDPLTGLVNRYDFEHRLQNALASTHPTRPHALLYLDLDQFKVVNDTCGHGAGDELLRQLAVILQSKLRSRDTLARLGGDEFGVILEHCPLTEAVRIATVLRDLVHDFRFGWNGKTFSLGVSVGLVSITSSEESLSSLLSAADRACFVAKEKGRNRVHVYEADSEDIARRKGEMRWLPRIQNAISEHRLRLYCQTVVPTSPGTGAIPYCEILVRMLDEQGQLVPPGAFLPAAERYDRMLAIDRWVVKQSLATIAMVAGKASNGVFAINLSGQSIGEEHFLDFVIEELFGSGLNPNSVCFEITETAAISELSHVLRFIDKLKSLGCRFALDDFGAGMSSFSYLKTLPVDYLKIDGRFVRDIVDNATDCAMVEAIHRIGHVMGLKTIAEWVESDNILMKLREMGVDYAQGYSIGTPKPLSNNWQFQTESAVCYTQGLG